MSYQKDTFGNIFTTPDGKPPAAAGVQVQIQTPNGPVSGTWLNNQAVPDKKQ